MLVRSCFPITLIKCLKGRKSLGSLCNVKSKSTLSESGTRSPIELFWTAKEYSNFYLNLILKCALPDAMRQIARDWLKMLMSALARSSLRTKRILATKMEKPTRKARVVSRTRISPVILRYEKENRSTLNIVNFLSITNPM